MTYTPRNPLKRIYKVDFTAQTTQSFKPDGNYTIDGKTWTTENSTNASVLGITNGTGLVMTINSGGQIYGDNTRSSALIRAALSQWVSPFRQQQIKGVRVMFRVTLTSATLNFQFWKGGFEYGSNPTLIHAVAGTGFSSAVSGVGIQSQVTSGTTSARDGTIAVGSNDVFAVTLIFPFGVDFEQNVFSGGNFPSSLTAKTSWGGGSPDTTLNSNFEVDLWRIVMSGQPTGAASPFTITITHMQIDELLFN